MDILKTDAFIAPRGDSTEKELEVYFDDLLNYELTADMTVAQAMIYHGVQMLAAEWLTLPRGNNLVFALIDLVFARSAALEALKEKDNDY